MMQKQYIVPALLLGTVLVGGGSALAAPGPRMLDDAALSTFTSAQQEAIERAYEIRATARTEAEAVLEAAGVAPETLREAMHRARQQDRTAAIAALEANDYDAFVTAVAGRPMAEKLTPDVFAILVEIHTLEQSGKKAEARALREELRQQGLMPLGAHAWAVRERS